MRLTCPNCGAQYEVPDEVIPETGRDVQCSNCGDTWFQNHPSQQADDASDATEAPHPGWDSPEDDAVDDFAPEVEDTVDDGSDDPAEDMPAAEPEDEATPEPEDPEEYEDAAEEGADEPEASVEEPEDLAEDDEADEEETPEVPARRALDPAIADLLREEAAREEEARAAEGGGLETQPDLGLDGQSDEDDQRSQQAKSRMARMRGLPEDSDAEAEDPEPDPGLISRRNLLPDIDEINSSLDSESVRAEAEQAGGDGASGGVAVGKSGFGTGFRRVVLLVLILVLLYVLAPVISENVPALAGVMKSYVDTVNAGRIWLNDWIGTMVKPE